MRETNGTLRVWYPFFQNLFALRKEEIKKIIYNSDPWFPKTAVSGQVPVITIFSVKMREEKKALSSLV